MRTARYGLAAHSCTTCATTTTTNRTGEPVNRFTVQHCPRSRQFPLAAVAARDRHVSPPCRKFPLEDLAAQPAVQLPAQIQRRRRRRRQQLIALGYTSHDSGGAGDLPTVTTRHKCIFKAIVIKTAAAADREAFSFYDLAARSTRTAENDADDGRAQWLAFYWAVCT